MDLDGIPSIDGTAKIKKENKIKSIYLYLSFLPFDWSYFMKVVYLIRDENYYYTENIKYNFFLKLNGF
jgi:hypothetical protein